MSQPVTKVDARFSDAGAAATEWEQTRRVLETAELFWLSTVRADGRPHVTPLVAVWFEGALHFTTGDTEQKAVNLRGNPRVILTTGCNQWQEGLDVVVEGDAVRVTDHDQLERLAQAWLPKWDGRWQFQVGDGCFSSPDDQESPPTAILVFAVQPTKIFAFAKGSPFSHTRHQF